MWKREHIIVQASHCCFLKLDASKDNCLKKETDNQLLLLCMHMSWSHSGVKKKCINVTVGLSDYDDDELSKVVVFMIQQLMLGFT